MPLDPLVIEWAQCKQDIKLIIFLNGCSTVRDAQVRPLIPKLGKGFFGPLASGVESQHQQLADVRYGIGKA